MPKLAPKTVALNLALALLALCGAETVLAGPGAQHRGQPSAVKAARLSVASAPRPYRRFCADNPAECRTGGPDFVSADPDLLHLIRQVNREVNQAMVWTEDAANAWTIGGALGDCEDFALTKRSRLTAAGVPPGALRMAIVRNHRDESHAVLVVRTTAGDLVLDNSTPRILNRQATGYRWMGIASADPLLWQLR